MRQTRSKNYLSVFVIFFILFIMISSEAIARPIKIVFSIFNPKESDWAEIYLPWFDEIEKRTNGNVRIEQHWNGELVGMFEAYDAVVDGIVDMAQFIPVFHPNKFPMEDHLNFNSSDTFVYGQSQMVTELHQRIPEMRAAYKDVKLLHKTVTFPVFISTRKGKAFNSLEEGRGIKLVTSGKWDSAKAKAIGMVPITINPADTFLSLQTGVIDGLFMSFPSIYEFGLSEVAPNHSLVNARAMMFACVLNNDVWKRIPSKYQNVIDESCEGIPAKQDAIQLRLARDVRKKMNADPNITLIDFSKEELGKFDSAYSPIREQFIDELNKKGLPGDRLMRIYKDLENKYASKKYEKYT